MAAPSARRATARPRRSAHRAAAALAAGVLAASGAFGLTQAPAATASPTDAVALAADLPLAVPAEIAARQAALAETERAASAESARLIAAGKFFYPTLGELGSGWGPRRHPILGIERMHEGVDVGSPCDAPVWAVLAGTVVATGRGESSGNYIRIDHGLVGGRHLVTTSMHLNTIQVAPQQAVARGQQVGLSGSTGLSTSCHVHLALTVDGVNSDPVPYLTLS
jgi:murein DD-endopeptidase MepM/ murein hydrolase activator NlpD